MSNDVQLELFYDGAWHDLAGDERLLVEKQLEVRRDGVETSAPAGATLDARIRNDDDLLRPANPESPLYDTAGVNTPVRLTVGTSVRAMLQLTTADAGESTAFRPGTGRGKAWVDVQATGLLQQINQNAQRLDSPIVRQTSSLSSLIGFFPLEDESGSASLTNLAPRGRSGSYAGTMTIGSTDRPGGAARAVQAGSDGTMFGRFLGATGSGWQVVFSAKIPATLTGTSLQIFRVTDSLGRTWSWEIDDDSYAWHIRDSEDNTITYQATIRGGVDPTRWIRHRLKATQSGGTTTLHASWYEEGASGGLNTSKTFSSSTTGQPRSWSTPANVYTDGAGYSAVYAVSDPNIELQTGSPRDAFNGYAGERAGTRFLRLLTELGLNCELIGDAADTMPMGPQPAEQLPEILREIRDTEVGLMFDARDELAVVMMTRAARQNQTPVSVSVTEMPGRPREVTAAAAIYNIVTVKNRDGAEVVTSDVEGPYGTAARGPYERSITINVDDESWLPGIANWWLQRGTLGTPRYPQVAITLNGLTGARLAELEAIDIGSAIEIPDYRPDPIRLYVTACPEIVGWPNERRLVLSCEPDDMFVVGVYDSSRRDSSSTTLAAAAEIGQTSLSLTTAVYSDRWSTTAVPYDLTIAGERCTCTGMTAAAGTGPWTQTATVVRARNNIRKRLPAGAEVHLADRVRYALKEGIMPSGDVIYASDFDRPKVRLVQQSGGTQTINTTDTTVTFGTGSEDYDTHGWHDETVNNSRITVDRDGYVEFYGSIVVNANTTVTALMCSLFKNGSVLPGIGRDKPSTNNLSHSAEGSWRVECVAGDYFELIGSTAGASVTTISSGRFASVFEAEYRGAS